MRVLDAAAVSRALDLDALVDVLADTFVAVSEGRVSSPPRVAVEATGGPVLLMGAHVRDAATVTAKIVGIFAGNATRGVPTHQAMVVVLDAATGQPLAVMDGEVITAARTAAASRLATRLLAAPEADTLAVIGTGVQARVHVEALLRERRFARVTIAGRRTEAAEALAAELAGGDAEVVAAPDAERALQGAGVVCLTTSSSAPVLRREWVADGAHVNSVGYVMEGGELDPALVAEAFVAVESRAAALAPPPAGAGDLATVSAPPAELGELVSGRATRPADARVTVYKAVGLGVEDDAAARVVLGLL